jgi:hypothetical protein
VGRDAITGIVVLVASLALYWATLGIDSNPLVPVSPALYPRIVLGLTAAFAALVVLQGVLAGRRPGQAGAAMGPRSRYGMVAAMFALFGAYVLSLPYLGFRIATVAFLVAMQAALEPPRGWRRWATVTVVAVLTTAVIYYMFDQYLQVLLPRGRWTDV